MQTCKNDATFCPEMHAAVRLQFDPLAHCTARSAQWAKLLARDPLAVHGRDCNHCARHMCYFYEVFKVRRPLTLTFKIKRWHTD